MDVPERQDPSTPTPVRRWRDRFARLFPARRPDPEPIAQHVVLAAMTLIVAAVVSVTGADRLISAARFLISPDAPIYADVLLGTHSRSGRPVVIVDIDEDAYAAWGRPAGAPRDKLVEAVERIAAGGPRDIVLDVDLSLDRSADAETVRALLNSWTSRPDAPSLFLVRSLLPRRGGRVVADEVDLADTQFDAVVSASANVRWVAARVDSNDGGTIREWSPVMPVCTRHDVRGVPSVGLALAANHPDTHRSLAELDRIAHETGRALCAGEPTDRVDPSFPALGIRLPIPYAFAAEEDRGGLVDFATDPKIAGPLFRRIPITDILTGPPPDVSGQTVLIGATHSGSRDIQRTPLGPMPGVVILANIAANGAHGLATTRWNRAAPVSWGLFGYLLGLASSVLIRPPWNKLVVFGAITVTVVAALLFGVSASGLSVAGLTMVGLSALHVAIAQIMRSERRSGTDGHWLLTDQAWALLRSRRRENDPPNTGVC